jgi:hypothetical protein
MNKLIFHVPSTVLNQIPENYDPGVQHARPLKLWRKTGCMGVSPGFPCKGVLYYEQQQKLLKVLPADNSSDGPVGAVKGNVMSFSGNARLISGATNLAGDAYSATFAEHLRKRGRTFKANSNLHKIDGVVYYNDCAVVQPETAQENPCFSSASFYGNDVATTPDGESRPIAIYKPNNANYSVQGAVDSSTRLVRLKYNTLQTVPTPSKKFPSSLCKKKGCVKQTA